ncbi:hypothetical protein CRUP_020720 [Coryphaenoides rupestris]|nr:hypothetical protein CRUP_020720 [Coryphaenoides rupestris]
MPRSCCTTFFMAMVLDDEPDMFGNLQNFVFFATQPELYLLPVGENNSSVCSQSLTLDTRSSSPDHQAYYPHKPRSGPAVKGPPIKVPATLPATPSAADVEEDEEEEEEGDEEEEVVVVGGGEEEESCCSTEGEREEARSGLDRGEDSEEEVQDPDEITA